VFNKRTETMMDSVNVVIDEEEVGASRKGEEIQPIPTDLPIPSANIIKPSASPQETPGISPVTESLPVPPNVTFEIAASAFEDED
jgi:hypothetical protein